MPTHNAFYLLYYTTIVNAVDLSAEPSWLVIFFAPLEKGKYVFQYI